MRLRYIVQAVLLLSVWGVMLLPGGGEWYARHIYPAVSGRLSFFSFVFPFSVGDVFIYGSIAWLLLYALVAVVRRRGVRRMLRREVVYLVWVYIWSCMGTQLFPRGLLRTLRSGTEQLQGGGFPEIHRGVCRLIEPELLPGENATRRSGGSG